jgi:hypothetical protein
VHVYSTTAWVYIEDCAFVLAESLPAPYRDMHPLHIVIDNGMACHVFRLPQIHSQRDFIDNIITDWVASESNGRHRCPRSKRRAAGQIDSAQDDPIFFLGRGVGSKDEHVQRL